MVGANHVDIEVAHRATELRDAVARLRALGIDAEHPGFVAVERDRLAVTLKIRTGRMEVAECRLGLAHPERHELTGRIIDIDQEHTARSAVLEPVVVRAVDLHELAVAVATVTRLLDALLSLRTGLPDPVFGHPFSERLD